MKFQVVGISNGNTYLLELDDTKIKLKAQRCITEVVGPDGSISKMITPEADRISKEQSIDLTLKGILKKND